MAIVYCAVVKRKKKLVKRSYGWMFLRVNFANNFFLKKAVYFWQFDVFVVVEVKNNRFFLKKALIINAIIVVNYMH